MFKIGDLVKTYFCGKLEVGEVVGKHGSADYYSVKLDNGYSCYRYGEDLEIAFPN